MTSSKQMKKVTVCITGDIDYFEIETAERCLELWDVKAAERIVEVLASGGYY